MFDDDDIPGQREAQQRLQQKRLDDDFLWLMESQRGRRIVWSQMCSAKMFQTTFDTHGGRMSLNEGMRQHGLYLLGEINRLCPEKYPVMVRENSPQPEKQNDD
jgi:hypothetical protein